MKTNITSLVDEAVKELRNADVKSEVRAVLTSLAEKATQNGLQPLPEDAPLWFMPEDLYEFRTKEWNKLRQHFGTKPAEWWMKLKRGDKFINHLDEVAMFRGVFFHWEIGERRGSSDPLSVNPYTEPTDKEKLIASFTPEQLELAKKLKIEEGER